MQHEQKFLAIDKAIESFCEEVELCSKCTFWTATGCVLNTAKDYIKAVLHTEAVNKNMRLLADELVHGKQHTLERTAPQIFK